MYLNVVISALLMALFWHFISLIYIIDWLNTHWEWFPKDEHLSVGSRDEFHGNLWEMVGGNSFCWIDESCESPNIIYIIYLLYVCDSFVESIMKIQWCVVLKTSLVPGSVNPMVGQPTSSLRLRRRRPCDERSECRRIQLYPIDSLVLWVGLRQKIYSTG